MIVDAVDEGQTKVCAHPPENSVYPARSRYSAAAEGVKGRESEPVRSFSWIRAGMGQGSRRENYTIAELACTQTRGNTKKSIGRIIYRCRPKSKLQCDLAFLYPFINCFHIFGTTYLEVMKDCFHRGQRAKLPPPCRSCSENGVMATTSGEHAKTHRQYDPSIEGRNFLRFVHGATKHTRSEP